MLRILIPSMASSPSTPMKQAHVVTKPSATAAMLSKSGSERNHRKMTMSGTPKFWRGTHQRIQLIILSYAHKSQSKSTKTQSTEKERRYWRNYYGSVE